MIEATEWFCETCCSVFHKAGQAQCCGSDCVPFDLQSHGRRLIPASNAWVRVWGRWKDHPLVREVSREHHEMGNSSAPSILNEAIERGIERND